jgi:hypothetical protein
MCAAGSALQHRRCWSEPKQARRSSAALPWQPARAETVGLDLAGCGRRSRSARQGGVEVDRALSEDAPEWSAGKAMGGGAGALKRTKPILRSDHRSGSGGQNQPPWSDLEQKNEDWEREQVTERQEAGGRDGERS